MYINIPHDKTLCLNMMGMKVVLVAILVTLTLELASSSSKLMLTMAIVHGEQYGEKKTCDSYRKCTL